MTRRWIARAALVVVCTAGHAGAVTYDWRPGQSVPGVDGQVNACITWDPDGPGPLPEWLVVAGQFRVAGDVIANNIAAWDGQRWHALGDGLGDGGNSWVFSLTVFNGQLIAGGDFYYSGNWEHNVVARFNGTTWEPLDEGLDDSVFSLCVYNGQLIASGYITGIWEGTTGQYLPCNGIVSWDGQRWRPFGTGWPGAQIPYIPTMVVYDGRLIAAGQFDRDGGALSCIAQWDGASWQSLGDGLNSPHAQGGQYVLDLTTYNGDLIAAKLDEWADDIVGIQQRGTVASWNGTAWRILSQDDVAMPSALTVYKGQLVCSSNDYAGIWRVATWDGAAWQCLPGNTNGPLCVYKGDLIVGGGITTADVSCEGVSRWDGVAWHSLGEGMNWNPTAIGTYHGDLMLCAELYDPLWMPYTEVLRWDGQAWQPLRGRLTTPAFPYGVDPSAGSMTQYNDDLIIGGWFTHADGTPCNGIVRWDGKQWQDLDGGMTASSGYANVQALIVYNGDLIVGGNFDTAGGVASNGVARWDGKQWHVMDAGLTGIYHEDHDGALNYWPPWVSALAVYNGELIAGGTFTTTGAVSCSNIARWDGSSWQPLGTGLTYAEYSCVASLAVYNGQLVVAGYFSQAGDVSCDSIAAWDGSQWHALSGPLPEPIDEYLPRPSYVGPVTVYNHLLIAGGGFLSLDPASPITADINAWDGSQWQPLGSGTNGSAGAMLVYDNDLVMAGYFTVVGGKVANGLARWGPQYPADFNADGHVDVVDLLIFLDSYGKSAGDAGYDAACDLNGDNSVDAVDLLALIGDWGK